MKEFFDFRLRERLARKVFLPNEGKLIGDSVRLIIVQRPSNEFDRIFHLHQKAISKGDSAVYSWGDKRKYSVAELQASPLIALIIRKVFEPAGEEYGTVYDETNVCPYKWCGVGAIQTNPLKLPASRLPRTQDFARTIAGEIVISKRIIELIRLEGFTGVSIKSILSPKTGIPNSVWSQLSLYGIPALNILPETESGISPVEKDEIKKYVCPFGHVLGIRRLSELVVEKRSTELSDFYKTKQTFGLRSGLLRPEHVVVISQRVYRALSELDVKGCDFEVIR